MTAAQFIDAAKKALDEFGDRGLDTGYSIGGFWKFATYNTDMDCEVWWQCLQQFCVSEGKEIM